MITEAWLKALGVPDGMRAIPMDKPRRSYHVGMVLADREPAPLLARALLDVTQRLDLPSEFAQASASVR